MSRKDNWVEYAVWVPDRGYIGCLGELREEMEMGVEKSADAIKVLESATRKYTSMGCPEIAETLVIVQRTVTLIRGDWSPVNHRKETSND